MAWACTVRSCVLTTSYMTLASSPGWTAMLRVVGRKRHGPCELPSSSTVTVRLVSIWVLAGRTTVPSRWVSTLMPSSSHICLYTGTRAYPKPNITTVTTSSLPSIDRFKRNKRFGDVLMDQLSQMRLTNTITKKNSAMPPMIRPSRVLLGFLPSDIAATSRRQGVLSLPMFQTRLLDDGRHFEGVERRRARHGPLQAFGAIPRFGGGLGAATDGGQHDEEQEVDLRQAETEGADGGNGVEVGEHGRVVGVAARHACQPQEVHGEEGDVEGDQRSPEVELAAAFVVHVAGPFRRPVIKTGEQGKQGAGHQHVVEVGHHIIGVLQLDVDRGHGQDQAREAAFFLY